MTTWVSSSMTGAARRPRSAAPGGAADHAAEVQRPERGILVRQHVGLDVAERRGRLVLDAVVEGLNDIVLEVRRARMRLHHSLALRGAEVTVGKAQYVHLDAGGQQRHD